MKILDIAFKDMLRSFRSFIAVVFMFGIPLLMTGMFYLMFGNIASDGDFSLPRTTVIAADLDEGGPRFQISTKNIPGGRSADTLGELIISILESDEMAEFIELSLTDSADSAHAAVDSQVAQVAIIIPPDFSKQFADTDGRAVIEFYQDPTLTIGPQIIRSILYRFMYGMAGVKIAADVFIETAPAEDLPLTGLVVERYLDNSLAQAEDLESELLNVQLPVAAPADENDSLLQLIVSNILGAMLIFYAFFTGASAAQSIIKEEEDGTLPRLFTTPTPQVAILSGKFLAGFLTVLVQVTVLLLAGHTIFGIHWGELSTVVLVAGGLVLCASTFGIFINSFLKSTKQGGVIFGGVLTMTGMLGMIRIFAMNSPIAAQLGDTVSLLVPQGWAVRGLLQAMDGSPLTEVGLTTLVMCLWAAMFFIIGAWRFNRRYV
jgi:ABC-type transport system involved in multi-copper enzyme maturation permease subunit